MQTASVLGTTALSRDFCFFKQSEDKGEIMYPKPREKKELLVTPTKMLRAAFFSFYFVFSFVLKSKYNAYFGLFSKTKRAKEI